MPTIALLQMNSGIVAEDNLAQIERACEEAAGKGAAILFTPEMSVLLDRDRRRAARWIERGGPEAAAEKLAGWARHYGIDIALGSMPVPAGEGRWANRSIYFSHEAGRAASYDKIHMFDVDLSTGESWHESKAYRPGERVVTVPGTAIGRLGLAVCYDMRFPALFEALGRQRCDAIAVPAAFTRPTGEAHWHVLLRARAIEASGFVIAAAQVGAHADGRETYGHSLVVDPWGEVLLDMGGDAPGLGLCEIDLDRIDAVRAQVPSLANRREIANWTAA